MKTENERGPFGAWAFRVRDELDLSVETVAAAIGFHPASIRKIESGAAEPSRRIRRELPAYYAERAREKDIAIDEPPEEADEIPASVTGLLVAHTELLTEIRDELRLSRAVSERNAIALARVIGDAARPESRDPEGRRAGSGAHARRDTR